MPEGIGQWIVRHAERHPGATALVDAETATSWTYTELDRQTSAVAAGLRAAGLQRGDRLALLTENCPQTLVLLLAAAKLGAITVPVNFRLAPHEVAFVLEDSGARLLAVSGRLADLAAEALGLAAGVQRVLDVDDASEWDALCGHDPMSPLPDVAGGDVCVVMYTSGTTGVPKGAMLTHDNLLWNAVNVVLAGPGLSQRDVTIAVAPLFHIGALGLSALPLLYVGGTVVVQNGFDPALTWRRMREYGVTTQFMVPAMWAAMTKVEGIAETRPPALRYALCGGAPCPLAVIEFFVAAGWTFLEGFGMTELSPAALFLDAADVVAHAGSVGRPFMHVDARLVDPDDHPVPVGTVGELVLRGPTVLAGYWGRPDATAEAIRNGWFHTGDLGVADADGFVTLVDRIKDLIITGGENVYPIEVERVLQRHPAVEDSAVIGVGDREWGETVLAVVVAKGEVTPAELIDFCRTQIAHFKCPTRVELVDVLPRNATGKLLKRTLRERYSGSGSMVTR